MNKILLLSMANIRKSKGNTFSMFLMVLIASLLLSAGVLVFFNFGSYFSKVEGELKAADAYYLIPEEQYDSKAEEYLNESNQVSHFEEETVIWTKETVDYNNEERNIVLMLCNMDHKRNVNRWKYVGDYEEAGKDSIYLPYIFGLEGKYKIGDRFNFKIGEEHFSYEVKGFTEDIYFSSQDTGIMGMYLPEEAFQDAADRVSDKYFYGRLFFTKLKTIDSVVEGGLRELLGADGATNLVGGANAFISLDKALLDISRTMMPQIIAAMLIVFALIITVICMLVVKFRIGTNIADDMTKIGSLKAAGYTSWQIIASIVLQFTGPGILGSVLGIVLCYPVLPVLSDVFAVQSGLKWEPGISIWLNVLTFVILLAVITAVSYTSSRKIRKINPITALRNGIVTHNFKKNHLPLEKAAGPLVAAMAMKSMFHNKRQSIMIAVILTAISFANTFAVVMYYNSAIDTTTFAETPGMELSNAAAYISKGEDTEQIISDVEQYPEVEKAQFLDDFTVAIEKQNITGCVMEDYSAKKTNTIYEGRYPLHDNEIALSGSLCEKAGRKIGDTLSVQYADSEETYLITGLTQGASMGGTTSFFTKQGFQRLNPDYQEECMEIYLEEGTDAKKFIKELEHDFGSRITMTIDVDKAFYDGMAAYTSIVSKVSLVILIITILIIILVLYFLIHASVVRRKRDLGIQKALGFTTFQLMNQMSASFLLPVICGIVFGIILGITQTNSLMTIIYRQMGSMKANFIITPVWIILFGAVTLVLTYVTSLLITSRIRKISAYELIQE